MVNPAITDIQDVIRMMYAHGSRPAYLVVPGYCVQVRQSVIRRGKKFNYQSSAMAMWLKVIKHMASLGKSPP